MNVRFFEAYKGRLPARIEGAGELSCTEKRVLLRLGRYEGRHGEARPKLETLAVALGISWASAQRAVAALERQGLIEVTRRHHGRLPSLIVFLNHPWLHEAVPDVDGVEPEETKVAEAKKPVPKPRRSRPAKPTQVELPGVPAPPPPAPREPSVHELNHIEFQESRKERLLAIGVEPKPDTSGEFPFVMATMKRLRDACGENDEELCRLFDAYLAEVTPSSYEPPYSLKGLASEKWWRPLLAKIRGESEARA